jgi:CheY-like chemotaxis protein
MDDELRPNKWRVLVVDDDAAIRRTYARVLRTIGDVTEASTGEAALARITAGERFDAIVCDLSLGAGMGGIALVERVAAIDPAQWRKIVVIAGTTPTSDEEKTLPHPSLAKPVQTDDLREIVERIGRGDAPLPLRNGGRARSSRPPSQGRTEAGKSK